jgi:hypothetical protein
MSFGITIFLSQKKISKKDYLPFLDECSSILGEWLIHEIAAFNLNAAEEVHDCVLLDHTQKFTNHTKNVSVWVSLERRDFIRKYGRSRRKIHWAIYTETKAGRSFWSLVIQMLIALKAFEHFSDIIVVVDPEKVFLHPKNYKSFVVNELIKEYGEEAVAGIGALDLSEEGSYDSFKPTAIHGCED